MWACVCSSCSMRAAALESNSVRGTEEPQRDPKRWRLLRLRAQSAVKGSSYPVRAYPCCKRLVPAVCATREGATVTLVWEGMICCSCLASRRPRSCSDYDLRLGFLPPAAFPVDPSPVSPLN